MTIGIIGLGYVGLTLAVAAAERGLTVYGIETNSHIKQCLAQNHAHFFEPELDRLIEKQTQKNFFCVDSFPQNVTFDAFIITVGTPLINGEKQPDFNYIRSSVQSLADVYNGEQLIVLRSTVSVGTTRTIVLPYLSEMCGKPESDLLVAMCPERTIEGKAVAELTGLPQIISGNNERSIEIASVLFQHIAPHVIVMDSLEQAEIVKLFCNVYRDMMFAVGNVLCMSAQEFGVDGIRAIQAANDGYSRSNISLPGFVAGPCLEKDAYLLTNNMPECLAKDFILSERRYNEYLEDIVIDWIERQKHCKTIALSGMAFKGRPETSDLRGSSSVYIARKLQSKGYHLHLHDFVALPEELNALALGKVFPSIYEACESADLLLVLNNNTRYVDIKANDKMSRPDFTIFDAWGICSELVKSGANIVTLGNINIGGNDR